MIVCNDSNSLKYFDRTAGVLHDSIRKEDIFRGVPHVFSQAFEARVLSGRSENLDDDIIFGWTDLPPFSAWYWKGSHFNKLKQSIPNRQSENMQSFLNCSQEFFSSLGGGKIAVHASGGLDTGIIIGAMRKLKIPINLIGLKNDRYEFRTESIIQSEYKDQADFCRMLDYEACLPYSSLEFAPIHTLPDLGSINYAAEHAMAKICNENGIDILITGAGGDLVLSSSRITDKCYWDIGSFYMPFFKDYVYQPEGVRLVPFFAYRRIADCLWNLRRGEGYDPKKRWARKFFSEIVTDKLSEYAYKSDFWGLYVDGLRSAKNDILSMNSNVYKKCQDPFFCEEKLKRLIESRIEDCDEITYKRIDAHIALVVWLNRYLI